MNQTPVMLTSTRAGADFVFQQVGDDLRLATPLGLGKPNQLLNEIYTRVAQDPKKRLKVFTALSLRPPEMKEDLARRFFGPFSKRQWGENYPVLRYSVDAIHGKIPSQIQVHEFYFHAGSALKSTHLQRHYQSVNYTHVAEDLLRADGNVIVQMIAMREEAGKRRYSLSCNPDVTLDVFDLYRRAGKKIVIVGVVHRDLPFLEGDAEVEASFFDAIVDSGEMRQELFALPRMPISPEDHLIGFYASQLMPDDGTIQIGIGSLSDAIVSALRVRQSRNDLYVQLQKLFALPPSLTAHSERFEKGLYGLTEMLTDGYMHLRQAGILKREIIDESSGLRTFVHGSFFLGSKPFYEWLRKLPREDAAGLRMTRVSKVNDLYDPQETLLRRQRVRARFYNTTMQVSALGEAMSETLPDARVVSGIGGQYNFVAMSRELSGARSVLMLRSTRLDEKGRRASNIVWECGHVSISRHLRDIVVTEYGAADLRGKSDEECVMAMLAIVDSEFQDDLIKKAKRAGKLAPDFELRQAHRQNTPERIRELAKLPDFRLAFPPFPFGSDFTTEEESLALALGKLSEDKKRSLWTLLRAAIKGAPKDASFEPELQRMGLSQPKSLKERFYRRLVVSYLAQS